jgi:cell wall assembly regulator SMI1
MMNLWHAIVEHLQTFDETLLDCFNAPTSEKSIDFHEQFLECSLPNDLRFFYTNCCNGERDDNEIFAFGGWKLLPIENVVTAAEQLKQNYTKFSLIPFLTDGSGGYYCFDCVTRSEDRKFQIVRLDSEITDIVVIYNSFTDFLTDLVAQMEKGDFVYDEETRTIEREDGHSDQWAKEKYLQSK